MKSIAAPRLVPLLATAAVLAGIAAGPATAAAPPAADQIAAAIQAAPAERRKGAAVLGYDEAGKLVTLRPGTNDLICLADDPGDDVWSVACYHEDLEPFMARGRELTAQGISGPARNESRFKEVDEGKLPLPKEARTLYVLHGSGYDAASHEVQNPYLRWVLYVPYATAESTGLSTQPTESAPWLMDPGTAGAHIMITPPRPNG
ncbi:MAG TPA: hypothetical protein VMS86_15160 [Thermoanaerobaculia bacterium]|nr:hypothetical protein [Thermoanaerobaculia bacterium]